ncbi:hypothetical protein SUDANB120_06203 (plasmid) [Streptomyces sp. enrichment culture]|uniref:hypothetical protein n=1 Tax=Streptomyces sp. enrichment culture TaxID=1795815 RepID=UPI003F56542E
MIERVFRQSFTPLPMPPDTTIPLSTSAQTGMCSTLSVGVRLGSLLTAAALAAVVCKGAPPELMLTAAPAFLADRTAMSYWRIRRS